MRGTKIILAVLLACVLSATAVFANDINTRTGDYILGDINLDGEVDMNDAILLLQHSMFPNLYELDYEGSVDFISDGEIDMNDAIYLLQHSMFPELYPLEKDVFYTVTFYDFSLQKEPVSEFTVKSGSKAVYPDEEEHELWYEIGYEKSCDTEFFDEYVEESLYGYDYAHKLDYEWYCLDENGEYVIYDDSYVIEKDTDVYAKLKKADITIEIPEEIANVDEVLILNVPYESNTRYLDFRRDALFFNAGQLETKLIRTGIEEKINDEYRETADSYFDGNGVINDENEINKTDVYFCLYEMAGGKSEYEVWIWQEVENAVKKALEANAEWAADYSSVADGRSSKQALYHFFENRPFGTPPENAQAVYEDCKMLVEASLEHNIIPVTDKNVFILELFANMISSEDTFNRFVEKYIGEGCSEELMNRLPIHIFDDIYSERSEIYLSEIEKAIGDIADGAAEASVSYGIHFDINLVTEFLVPLMAHVRDVYAAAVERASDADCTSADIVKLYHVENPYATSYADGYMLPELFVKDEDGDGLYAPAGIMERYQNVIMPLEVEKADGLLWLASKVEFDAVEGIITAPENKQLGLGLVNRINVLKSEYSENGLPESIADYYNSLLDDELISEAVAKLDRGEDFDMMFFVETKINYQLAEMFYMKVLGNLGISHNKLIPSQLSVEYAEADYDDYVERLSKIWSDSYTVDDYLDEMFEKAGHEGENRMEIEVSGMKATLVRGVVNTAYEEIM